MIVLPRRPPEDRVRADVSVVFLETFTARELIQEISRELDAPVLEKAKLVDRNVCTVSGSSNSSASSSGVM